jgi:thiol-disulfide isomerase/thioredoxin
MAAAVSDEVVPAPGDAKGGSRRNAGRWWALAAAAVVLGASAGVGVATAAAPKNSSPGTSPSIASGGFARLRGERAASFDLPALVGGERHFTLAHFGGRPLVLNFWASWCTPCRSEMPALESAHKRLGSRVGFVGVDTQDSRGSARPFLSATGVTYPVVVDTDQEWARYGVFGLPTTFFISPTGRLLGRQVGGMTEQRVIEILRRLFPSSA